MGSGRRPQGHLRHAIREIQAGVLLSKGERLENDLVVADCQERCPFAALRGADAIPLSTALAGMVNVNLLPLASVTLSEPPLGPIDADTARLSSTLVVT